MLSDEQIATLLRPINPRRVLQAQGQSHLPAFDVEAHLSRIFGFDGWDKEILDLWLIHEDLEDFKDKKTGAEKQGWTVTYGCKLRLTVYGKLDSTGWKRGDAIIRDGTATGSANNLPSRGDAHDFAIKNADSYALKRAAKSWGDQFGLSLYNKGMTAPLVGQVVGFDGQRTAADKQGDNAIDAQVPEPVSMGHDEIDTTTGDTEEQAFHPDGTVMAGPKDFARLYADLPRNVDAHTFCSNRLLKQVDSLKHLTKGEIDACIAAARDA